MVLGMFPKAIIHDMISQVLPMKIEDLAVIVITISVLTAVLLIFLFVKTLMIAQQLLHLGSLFDRLCCDQLSQGVPEIRMNKVFLPFCFKLEESSSHDCVVFSISSQVDFQMPTFWGVPIQGLEGILNEKFEAPGDLIVRMREICWKEAEFIETNGENRVYSLEKPRLELGSPPRQVYPLVVVLFREALAEKADNRANVVVYLIVVIHVEHDSCKYTTRVIRQYLRTLDDRVTDLQPLFTSKSDCLNGENECVVCNCAPSTCVILPCRHAQVCASCVRRLRSCPLCRSSMISYFSL